MLGRIPLNIEGQFDADKNFWVINPQVKFFTPYADLYANDTSKDKQESSIAMWMILFMREPDEKENIFFRLTLDERKEMLIKNYAPNLDWTDPTFVRCYDSYEWDCMDAVERAYSLEKAKLLDRAKLISETKLTLDGFDEKGKPVKGTALQINTLQKDMLRIYESFEIVEAKFRAKKDIMRIKGGAKVVKSEREEMW